MDFDSASRKMAEIHEYVRHSFNLFFGWFTFFATVNYATMGWLAKNEPGVATKTALVAIVVLLFISQNLLGVAACFVMRAHLRTWNQKITELERLVQQNEKLGPSDTSIPIRTYLQVVNLIVGALGLLVVAWCFVWKVM